MATYGMATDTSLISPSGLASWKVKMGYGETPDDAYYTLGPLADAQVTVASLSAKNEYGHMKSYGAEVNASAKLLCTDKTSMLAKLSLIGYGLASHKLTTIDTRYISGNWGGLKWKFDSSMDYDGYRFIQVEAKERLLTAGTPYDLADLFTGSPSADGTPDAGDILYGLQGTLAYHPAGVSAIQINPEGDNEVIGLYRNGKLTLESMVKEDHKGRYVPFGGGAKVEFSAEMLQNAYVISGGVLDDLPDVDTAVVTLADGTVCTLTSMVGMEYHYELGGGVEGEHFIRITGSGYVSYNSLGSIFS